MADTGNDSGTNMLIFPRDFREMVQSSPCHELDYYVKFGERRFGISEMTARKRLQQIIDGIEFFVYYDRQDARIKRLMWKGLLAPKDPDRMPRGLEYGVLAEICLHHEQLKDPDYHKRAEVYTYCMKLARFGMSSLEISAAKNTRQKFPRERHKAREFLSQIESAVDTDPEADKIRSLLLAHEYGLEIIRPPHLAKAQK